MWPTWILQNRDEISAATVLVFVKGLQNLIYLNISANELGLQSFDNIYIFLSMHMLSKVSTNNVAICCMFNQNVSCTSDFQHTVQYSTDCSNIITNANVISQREKNTFQI